MSEGKFNSVEEIHCPECGSKNYYYRKQSQDYFCRKCGQVFQVRVRGGIMEILWKPLYKVDRE